MISNTIKRKALELTSTKASDRLASPSLKQHGVKFSKLLRPSVNSTPPIPVPVPHEKPTGVHSIGQQPAAENVIKVYKINAEEQQKMCDLISLTYMPESARHKGDDVAKPPRKKPVRSAAPTDEWRANAAAVVQNTLAWYLFRDEQYGCSGVAMYIGWEDGPTNVLLYMCDVGLRVAPARKEADYIYTDHGHYYEDEAGDVNAILMGTESSETGILIRDDFFILHCSPDRVTTYRPGVYHNIHTLDDPPNTGLEIKCPIFDPYMFPLDHMLPGMLPHTIPVKYLLQIICQIFVMKGTVGTADYEDFCSHWRFNLSDPPRLMHEDDDKVLIAHHLVSRVYMNWDLFAGIQELLETHAACVRAFDPDNPKANLPPQLNKPKFGDVKIKFVPLKTVRFWLHLPKDNSQRPMFAPGPWKQKCAKSQLYDVQPFYQPPLLTGEDGTLLGHVTCEIDHHWEAKPVEATLMQLYEKDIRNQEQRSTIEKAIRAKKLQKERLQKKS